MIYPTIAELTKEKFNRYELVVGVAKSARIVTDEYVKQRQNADRIDAGVDAVRERKIDNAIFSTIGDRGFRGFLSQCVKTASLTACQQHGNAFFFLEHSV